MSKGSLLTSDVRKTVPWMVSYLWAYSTFYYTQHKPMTAFDCDTFAHPYHLWAYSIRHDAGYYWCCIFLTASELLSVNEVLRPTREVVRSLNTYTPRGSRPCPMPPAVSLLARGKQLCCNQQMWTRFAFLTSLVGIEAGWGKPPRDINRSSETPFSGG